MKLKIIVYGLYYIILLIKLSTYRSSINKCVF